MNAHCAYERDQQDISRQACRAASQSPNPRDAQGTRASSGASGRGPGVRDEPINSVDPMTKPRNSNIAARAQRMKPVALDQHAQSSSPCRQGKRREPPADSTAPRLRRARVSRRSGAPARASCRHRGVAIRHDHCHGHRTEAGTMTAPLPAATPSQSQSSRRAPQRLGPGGPEMDRAYRVVRSPSSAARKKTSPSSLSSAASNIYTNLTMPSNVPVDHDCHYYCLY